MKEWKALLLALLLALALAARDLLPELTETVRERLFSAMDKQGVVVPAIRTLGEETAEKGFLAALRCMESEARNLSDPENGAEGERIGEGER